MEVLRYEPGMAPELTSVYNELTCVVPHCYPVHVDDFASAVAPGAAGGSSQKLLHSEAVFVGRAGGSVLGFIHVAVQRPEEDEEREEGIIRFFAYERGHRAAGQDLLAAAEDYLRERGVRRITAFEQDYRYPFYHFDHAYLSDHLDLVQAMLGFNGYRRVAGEVFLDGLNYDPIDPGLTEVDAEISLEWKQGTGARPGLIVLAHQGEERIGVCESVSCGEFSRADEVQDWFFTEWLYISDDMQGKGLGRYLLLRVRQEMHRIGYRHAGISTSWENFRALLFYSNYGYRVVDWTYGLRREG